MLKEKIVSIIEGIVILVIVAVIIGVFIGNFTVSNYISRVEEGKTAIDLYNKSLENYLKNSLSSSDFLENSFLVWSEIPKHAELPEGYTKMGFKSQVADFTTCLILNKDDVTKTKWKLGLKSTHDGESLCLLRGPNGDFKLFKDTKNLEKLEDPCACCPNSLKSSIPENCEAA